MIVNGECDSLPEQAFYMRRQRSKRLSKKAKTISISPHWPRHSTSTSSAPSSRSSRAKPRWFVAPGEAGDARGCFPKHARFSRASSRGQLRIKIPVRTARDHLRLRRMMEVQPHVVTRAADTSVRAENLDEAKALEAKRAAEDTISRRTGDMEIAEAQAVLAEAVAQLAAIRNCGRFARRRRSGPRRCDKMLFISTS